MRVYCGAHLGWNLRRSKDLDEPILPINLETHVNILAKDFEDFKFKGLNICIFIYLFITEVIRNFFVHSIQRWISFG